MRCSIKCGSRTWHPWFRSGLVPSVPFPDAALPNHSSKAAMLPAFSQCFGAVPNFKQSQSGVVEPQWADRSPADHQKWLGFTSSVGLRKQASEETKIM